MIRNHSAVLLSLSSVFCLSLMGMQTDEELCLPYHKVPSHLSLKDTSLALIMAATYLDLNSLTELVHNKKIDVGSLRLALTCAKEACNNNSKPNCSTDTTDTNNVLKRTCTSLLESALKER